MKQSNLGELSSGRQALEGADVVSLALNGHSSCCGIRGNVHPHPFGDELPRGTQNVPELPFDLDEKKFLTNEEFTTRCSRWAFLHDIRAFEARLGHVAGRAVAFQIGRTVVQSRSPKFHCRTRDLYELLGVELASAGIRLHTGKTRCWNRSGVPPLAGCGVHRA